jgi:hypothetical protein
MRSIAYSPPVDWDAQRKSDYIAWAKRVVAGFTAPNPLLKAEFHNVVLGLESRFADGSSEVARRVLST